MRTFEEFWDSLHPELASHANDPHFRRVCMDAWEEGRLSALLGLERLILQRSAGGGTVKPGCLKRAPAGAAAGF